MKSSRLKLLALLIGSCCCLVKAQSSEENDNQKKSFRQTDFRFYVQSLTGFAVTNEDMNEGHLIGGMEFGVFARHYFKRYNETVDTYRPRQVSLFAKTGWGPLLTEPTLVPNFWTFDLGFAIDGFGSSTSYSLVYAINSSDRGPDYLYGFSCFIDKVQVPFFLSYLRGADSFQYILAAGIRVPLTSFIPWD